MLEWPENFTLKRHARRSKGCFYVSHFRDEHELQLWLWNTYYVNRYSTHSTVFYRPDTTWLFLYLSSKFWVLECYCLLIDRSVEIFFYGTHFLHYYLIVVVLPITFIRLKIRLGIYQQMFGGNLLMATFQSNIITFKLIKIWVCCNNINFLHLNCQNNIWTWYKEFLQKKFIVHPL